MKNLIKIDTPELQVIEKSKAKQIKETFEPMVKMLQSFEKSFSQILEESNNGITKETTGKAKRLRIEIGKVRIETEKVRKGQKEEYLRAGKAIDGVSNILKWAILEKENKLKEIENHFEIQEQKRLEALQLMRVKKLSQFVEDAHERDLSGMDEDVWNTYYNAKKKEYIDRIEAEKKAEAERIAKEKAEAEERERIKKENEKLKAEAEARAKAELIERKKREEKDRKERAAYEAKILAERKVKEKIEAELRARVEAERKVKEAEERREQDELNKGDSDKVHDLINDLKMLKSKYIFKSAKNKKMYNDVSILINKIINHIR